MKSLMFSLAVFALVVAVGCNRESEKAGPGADADKNKKAAANDPAKDDQFSIKVSSISTGVVQGERNNSTVTINRDGNFNEKVTLTFEPPSGLTVEPMSAEVASGAKDAEVSIVAAKDAKIGDTNIKVHGTSAGGYKTSVDMPVTVKAP